MPSMKAQPGESQPAANPAGGEAALPRGLSVVIPCYNGAESLDELVRQLAETLPRCAERYELILVNDDSPDETWKRVCELTRRHTWVRGINLMRNYGQHNATLCGIRAARYDVTVTMNDDLQHPPSEIPALLDRLAEGYDLVWGTPAKRVHAFHRFFFSWMIRFAVAVAARQRIAHDVSAFRALRTSLRRAFTEYRSPQLLIDIMLGWGTTRISSLRVRHDPRRHGRSNYGALRLIRAALLVVTGYTTLPLRFASLLGFAFVVFGMGVLAHVLYIYFLSSTLPGFPFLASTIAIFGGVQLFTLGIIGEYLARIFNRSLDRPTYVVKETAGFESRETAADSSGPAEQRQES
jgi:undecaprenyl-phosphate 4-deoxy-4-formamido-L-arabinose transferase